MFELLFQSKRNYIGRKEVRLHVATLLHGTVDTYLLLWLRTFKKQSTKGVTL